MATGDGILPFGGGDLRGFSGGGFHRIAVAPRCAVQNPAEVCTPVRWDYLTTVRPVRAVEVRSPSWQDGSGSTMRVGDTRRLVIAASIAISAHVACTSPTAPAPVPVGYVGEWTGTTQHGTPVRFSVSAVDEVTTITLTYNVSATCSGTFTYTDLAVPIPPPGASWPTTIRPAGFRGRPRERRPGERDGGSWTLLAGSPVGIGPVHSESVGAAVVRASSARGKPAGPDVSVS